MFQYRQEAFDKGSRQTTLDSMPSQEKAENFMKQFRNKTNNDLSELTASQLLAIWEHYDQDGNGYLEGDELDQFIFELVTSVCHKDKVSKEVVSKAMLEELKADFLDAYDENGDHRIEIKELAQMLPVDENFLLLFQLDNRLTNGVEFMKLWNRYDADHSGFIEGNELKDFMRNLIKQAHPDEDLSESKLEEYCQGILKVFDENNDGKLSLSEMARLLPIKENALKSTVEGALLQGATHKVDCTEIERIFTSYDKDNNGSIEADELSGFAKDLLSLMKPSCNASDVESFKDLLLESCDLDGDGKIGKDELTLLLLGLQKFVK